MPYPMAIAGILAIVAVGVGAFVLGIAGRRKNNVWRLSYRPAEPNMLDETNRRRPLAGREIGRGAA
jgi:hypothetical protein